MNLNLKVIETDKEFEELSKKWKELYFLSNDAPIFLSWEWMFVWWQVFSTTNDRLLIICILNEDDLIGICPLYIQGDLKGKGNLRFIGTGEDESEEVLSEYLDCLYNVTYEVEIIALLSSYLRSIRASYQFFELNRIRESSLPYRLIECLIDNFWVDRKIAGFRYCLNLLDLTFDNYLGQLKSKSFTRKLRGLKSKFNRLTDASYKIIEHRDELINLYPTLKESHEKDWFSKDKKGAFSALKFNAFHQQFINLASGKVKFLVLEVSHKVIAVFYYFMNESSCYYYQSGINKTIRPNVSPGYLGHILMIEYCIEHKIQFYDFMMDSDSSSYKSKFNPETEKIYNVALIKKNLFGLGCWLLREVRVRLRGLIEVFRVDRM